MSRELRRVLIVVVASAAGFGLLVLLRVLEGEPPLGPDDAWVVLIWVVLAILLIALASAAARARPPGRPRR